VMNAKETMSRGGKIKIRADNITLGPEDTIPLPEGNYVKISVEDHGGGISEEDLSRIFDPYFTTKEIGKGTGLGLPMVMGFVRQSKGYMSIRSEPGKGTVVRIILPAITEKFQTAK